jgi:hemerythrin-like domain-containing protein
MTRPRAQITLPGQAATPEGPLDMTLMYVMHHAFRRDLQALAVAAAVTPLEDRRSWIVMAERWRTFSEVLHHHHLGEDRGYWPLLAGRVAPEDLATLEAMEREHVRIDPLLRVCRGGFLVLSEPGAREQTRDALVRNLQATLGVLTQHLAHEETDAIPLLHEHITPEEDERIEEERFRGAASLSLVLRTVPWALHGLPEPVREQVWESTGRMFQMVWLLTRHRFARRDAVMMRHVRRSVDRG